MRPSYDGAAGLLPVSPWPLGNNVRRLVRWRRLRRPNRCSSCGMALGRLLKEGLQSNNHGATKRIQPWHPFHQGLIALMGADRKLSHGTYRRPALPEFCLRPDDPRPQRTLTVSVPSDCAWTLSLGRAPTGAGVNVPTVRCSDGASQLRFRAVFLPLPSTALSSRVIAP